MTLHPIEHKHSLFETELDDVTRHCIAVRIATAFIDGYTIKKVERLLHQRAHLRPNIHLVTGIYQRFNRKKNLSQLLSLAKKFPGNLDIRISSHDCFHWKYYAVEQKGSEFHFFIGSSNFTRSGLQSTGELMFRFRQKLTRPQDDPRLYVFQEAFAASTNILEFDIESYIERKLPVDRHADKKVKQLIQISPDQIALKHQPERFGVAFTIQHYATAATEKLIKRLQPDWEKKKWTWYTMTRKTDWMAMQRAKYLFNFYRDNGKDWIDVSSYQDRGQSSIRGARYLVAHRPIRTKAITQKLAEDLTDAGLLYKKTIF